MDWGVIFGLSPPAAKKLFGAKCIIVKDISDINRSIKPIYDTFLSISFNIDMIIADLAWLSTLYIVPTLP